VLVGLRAVAGQVFQPASRAAVPALVPEPDLERANAAVGVATNGGETLGPLVAAVALPVLAVRGVLLVDAATFLVSAALLALLPAMGRTGPGLGRQVSFLADAGAGLGYVRRQPTVRAVVGGYVAIVACNGIDDVALVFLATDTLGGGRDRGRAAAGRRRHRPAGRVRAAGPGPGPGPGPDPGRLLLAGFAVSSAGNLLTGLAWAVGGRLRRPGRPRARHRRHWTSPPPPWSSGPCRPASRAGSSAACTAGSGGRRPGLPARRLLLDRTSPGSRSWPPARPACWPPGPPPWPCAGPSDRS
jgi:hypothetical protein